MRIYKVKGFLIHKDKSNFWNQEEVIIDNINTATKCFEKYKDHINMMINSKNIVAGRCELFKPNIFKDGSIASFPEKPGEFILQYTI